MSSDQIGLIDAVITGFFERAVSFKSAIAQIAAILVANESPLGTTWTVRLAKCPARMGREAQVVVMCSAHGELRRAELSRIPSFLCDGQRPHCI